MMSKKEIVCVAAALTYMERHLSRGDYYSQDDTVVGRWKGALAKRFCIDGAPVRLEMFEAALQGEFSKFYGGKDRPCESKVKCIDFTFSPCKSVMILASLDERIARDIQRIVDDAWVKIEAAHARTNDGSGRKMGKRVWESRLTSELLCADFRHDTNRLGEPAIHFHRCVMNVTYDPQRDMFSALDARELFRYRALFDAEIQSNLAAYFLKQGYTTRTGRSGVFEIAQVPQEAIDLFSERTRQVEKRRAELMIENPTMASHVLHEQAVLDSRPKKVIVDRHELKEDVLKKLHAAGLKIGYPSRPGGPGPGADAEIKRLVDRAVEMSVQTIFTTETVVPLEKLKAAILKNGRGVVSPSAADEAIEKDPRFYKVKKAGGLAGEAVVYAPAKEVEERLIHVCREMMIKKAPLMEKVEFPAEFKIDAASVSLAYKAAQAKGEQITRDQIMKSKEQFAQAFERIMSSREQICLVQGAAGVGKSYMLSVLKRELQKIGKTIYAFAPTGKASRENLASDFPEAQTVAHLLVNKSLQNKLRGQVCVIDEAPLVDGESLAAVLELCRSFDCRVILQGDLKQQHSVAAIDGVRMLSQELGLGSELERLDVTRRQLKASDKQVAALWSVGKVSEAVELMHDLGMLLEGPGQRQKTREAWCMKQIASQYVSALKKNESTLVISSTHRQGDMLASAIRDRRKKVGQVAAKDYYVTSERLLNDRGFLSDGSRWFSDSGTTYKVGMRIVSIDGGKADAPGGGKLEVVAISQDIVTFRDQQGSVKKVDVSDGTVSAKYRVYEARQLAVSVGDFIRLTEKVVVQNPVSRYLSKHGDQQEKTVYERGSIHVISSVEADGTVVFSSGLKLHCLDGRMAQGYVTTNIPAQGASVDRVWAYESEGSMRSLLNYQSMYVAASRHKFGFRFFTDSTDAVFKYASRSNQRETYHEAIKRGRQEFEVPDREVFTRNEGSKTVAPPGLSSPGAGVSSRGVVPSGRGEVVKVRMAVPVVPVPDIEVLPPQKIAAKDNGPWTAIEKERLAQLRRDEEQDRKLKEFQKEMLSQRPVKSKNKVYTKSNDKDDLEKEHEL